jgi:transcriptional regulator with XRE-family HTH domain
MFELSIQISKLLTEARKKAGLSQTDVAIKMGMSEKSGCKYISRLEKGQVKKPYSETILNYLDAVGASWESFYRKLSVLRSKQTHENIMSKTTQSVILSHSQGMTKNLVKKLDRDALLYETKITPPQNFYTKVDLNIVR